MSRESARPTIREATAGDLDLVASMNRALLDDTRHRNPMDVAALRRRLDALLADGWQADLVVHEDRVVGYALHRQEVDPGEPGRQRHHLRQFLIAREDRRRGLGRAAFAALAAARFAPGARVVLEVLTTNEAGRRFWQSVGFGAYAETLEWQVAAADDARS
ncbi:MAG: GNAT family N-acetyltransferase [Pseudomonadota bacterium]